MKKVHLNLYVNEDLIKKAKQHGLILSNFFENKLLEYFSFINAVSNGQKTKKDSMGLLRFELKSMAPEATRIPSYPTGPNIRNQNKTYVEDTFGKNKIN